MRALIPILLAAAAACQAATVTVTIFPDTLTGNPGNLVPFSLTLLNTTGSTVFINSDSFTFAIGGAVDDSPFLNNAPLSLGAFASSGPFEFLTVTIPLAQASGTYDGAFTVQGGATDTASDNLGSGAFHVVVNSTVPAVPEPGPALLVALGIAAASWLGRRRRRGPAGARS
jgi:hypothetical protein